MSNVVVFLQVPEYFLDSYFEGALALGLEPLHLTGEPLSGLGPHHHRSRVLSEMSLDNVLAAIDEVGRDQVAGVYANQCAFAALAAEAAAAIGTPGGDPAAIRICNDKLLTRQKLGEAGISDVGCVAVSSREEAYAAAQRFGGKVVVKPRVATGSEGVRVFETPEAAADFIQDVIQNLERTGRQIRTILEEFVDGPQFDVEVFDGRTVIISRTEFLAPSERVPVTFQTPAAERDHVYQEIASYTEKVIKAVGFTRGIGHIQVCYTTNGPRLIEINPRIAGALGPVAVQNATGIDLIQTSLKFATGLPYCFDVDLTPKKSTTVSTRFLVRGPAQINGISGCERASAVPGVIKVGLYGRHAHNNDAPQRRSDRVAYVLSEDTNPEEAMRIAQRAMDRLRINRATPFHKLAHRLRQSVEKRFPAGV